MTKIKELQHQHNYRDLELEAPDRKWGKVSNDDPVSSEDVHDTVDDLHDHNMESNEDYVEDKMESPLESVQHVESIIHDTRERSDSNIVDYNDSSISE